MKLRNSDCLNNFIPTLGIALISDVSNYLSVVL